MHQGSVLGPLVFSIYINDLYNAIKSFHFADGTCLFNIEKTISKINRSVSKDLKDL